MGAQHHEVTPAGAAAFFAAKWARKREARQRLYEQARRDAERSNARLSSVYHPRHIYPWGSLVQPERFTELSDIDIAVEGIASAEEWFALYGDAMGMTEFLLDLVQFERGEPE